MSQLERFRPDKKLAANPNWVKEYIAGRSVYPIHLEVDPTNKCPLDCPHCVWHQMRHTEGPAQAFLGREMLLKVVNEGSELGIRGITWTGGGEPLSNRYTIEAIQLATQKGIKNGMFTTAVPLTEKATESLLGHLSWVRFHIDGATPESYATAHLVDPKVFDVVTANIRYFTKRKKETGVSTSAGLGTVAIPSHFDELVGLAYLAKDLGLDFFQYKHDITQMQNPEYLEWWNATVIPVLDRLSDELEDPGFKMQYSKNVNYMATDETPVCHVHMADTAITATGDVAYCKSTRDHTGKHLGNIHAQSLKEIFDGERHRRLRETVTPQNCGVLPCPLIRANQTLGQAVESQSIAPLGEPVDHIDFPEFL